jgi:2-C-methyl-D-erythritol 4-phosphate cytidylyltransferase
VENKVIFNSVKNASLYGASIAAVKSIDTVKIVEDEMVIDTLDRDKLRRVQTPQAFKYEILEESYKLVDRNNSKITDEAFIVESAGFPVHITESSEKNIKITTEFDLELAEFLLKKESL